MGCDIHICQEIYNRWGCDAHSATWLTSDEILKLENWYKEHRKEQFYTQFGYLFGNSWASKQRYPEDYLPRSRLLPRLQMDYLVR